MFKGFVLLKVVPDYKDSQKRKNVFIFKDSDNLTNAINEYSNLIKGKCLDGRISDDSI